MYYKHGLTQTTGYRLWHRMKNRCYNINDISYKNYGERGITIYKEWLEDKFTFIEYISKLDNYDVPGFSLDRINNDGNYEPGNLRWASRSTQNVNKRYKNISGYRGIDFNKHNNKWRLRMGNPRKFIGYFSTIEEAINASLFL